MPEACGRPGCKQRAHVTYCYDTDHPVPRCWEHAPTLEAAIAFGWIRPDTATHPQANPPHQARGRVHDRDPDHFEGPDDLPDREDRHLHAVERAYERHLGRT